MSSSSEPGPSNGSSDEKMSRSAMKKLAKKESILKMRAGKDAALKLVGDSQAKAKNGKESGRRKKKGGLEAESPHYELKAADDGSKVLPAEMPPTYQPKIVEGVWYDWWEKCGFFKPDASVKEKLASGEDVPKFTIVIPPPNVTGALHLGHALTNSVQDLLVRWHRMRGFETLWLPGTDHAGIATQAVVEKTLRTQGLTRHHLGREKFVERVWEWKEQYNGFIRKQLMRLGSSLDWDRLRFTMDDSYYSAVQCAFEKLFEKGLVYRATRLVNWCCKLKTALSDLEVVHKDISKSTKMNIFGQTVEVGIMEHFMYEVNDPVDDSPEHKFVTIATTRLETMLGDTGVAVHPDDLEDKPGDPMPARYKHLKGKTLKHPFFPERKIPIVADSILVDRAFGTGVVKVTPAHDPNDYGAGQRSSLEFINILTDDGNINENGGQFEGQHRFQARIEVRVALKKIGLYVKKEDHDMRLGLCYRTGDIIEPFLKPQWWVNCKSMADKALDAARRPDGLKIVPSAEIATWERWLTDIHDWCISRQLWWGHRIPAFFVVFPSEGEEVKIDEVNHSGLSRWVLGRNKEEAEANALKRWPDKKLEDIAVIQDEDVLDTWFSSGIFPFATMGWPNEEASDFKRYYPGSVLETGRDIIFFWVARMVMMGMELTDRIPFDRVYLHTMVRDAHGRKMSKSLGNVVDPIDVMEGITLEALQATLTGNVNLDEKERQHAVAGQKKNFPKGIAECGADALRFALMAYMTQGRDINLDIQRVVSYRQFGNKMWNAVRFAWRYFQDLKFDASKTSICVSDYASAPTACRWILSRLNEATRLVNENLETFEPGAAVNALYVFWLNELCDVFLELCKPYLSGDATGDFLKDRNAFLETLYVCIHGGLRLVHPFMPFVTEELFYYLPRHPSDPRSIMISEYPQWESSFKAENETEHMQLALCVVRALRSMRSAIGLVPKVRPLVTLTVNSDRQKQELETLEGVTPYVERLANTTVLIVSTNSSEPSLANCCATVVSDTITAYLSLEGLEGIEIASQVTKLKVKALATEKRLQQAREKSGEAMKNKISEEVFQEAKAQVGVLEGELKGIQDAIEMLEKALPSKE